MMFSTLFSQCIHLFYPPHCAVCKKDLSALVPPSAHCDILCHDCDPLSSGGEIQGSFFPQQNQSLSLNDIQALERKVHQLESSLCEVCEEKTTSWGNQAQRCVACYLWPPPLRRIHSMWRYTARAKGVVKALKYGNERLLSKYIGELLASCLASKGTFRAYDWDIIIPLPSSIETLKRRGYNHIGLISRILGKHLLLPVDCTSLRSKRPRPPQTSLEITDRHKNVKDAFSVNEKRIAGKIVLLVDDVMTTGASLFSAASELLEGGAKAVDAVTVCRSLEFQANRLLPSQHINLRDDLDRVGNG